MHHVSSRNAGRDTHEIRGICLLLATWCMPPARPADQNWALAKSWDPSVLLASPPPPPTPNVPHGPRRGHCSGHSAGVPPVPDSKKKNRKQHCVTVYSVRVNRFLELFGGRLVNQGSLVEVPATLFVYMRGLTLQQCLYLDSLCPCGPPPPACMGKRYCGMSG